MFFMPRFRATVAFIFLGLLAGAARSEAGCSVPAPVDRDGNGSLDIRIVGDVNRQIVLFELNPTGPGSWKVSVDCNHNGSYVDVGDIVVSGTSPVETVDFELAGNDDVTVVQDDDLSADSIDVQFVETTGINTFTFSSQGHGVLNHSNLGIDLQGGSRFEKVTLDFSGSTIDSSTVYLRGDLGPDGDRFDVISASTITASAVDLNMDLGAGGNTSSFDDDGGAMSASTVAVDLVTSDDRDISHDTVTTRFSGQIDADSRVFYGLNLMAGDDVYTGSFDIGSFAVDPSGPTGSEAHFYVNGGPGADSLTTTDTGTAGPATVNGLLDIDMDTSFGPDVSVLDWGSLTGSGTFRYRAASGDAADVMLASLATDPGSTNVLDFYVQTDAQEQLNLEGDLLYLSILDRGSASYGSAGLVIEDAGLDYNDYCGFFGNAPHATAGCEAGSY